MGGKGMKSEFYYPSSDAVTQIHAVEWIPEREVKAILQICHGMVEYVERYDRFASFLAEKGYYVVGNDHLGHGKSVQSEEEYGFFHEKNGNQCVIEDIRRLQEETMQKYPGVPYFMMGHSMGSFLLRQYLTLHGGELSGAIIMGTGYKSAGILTAGQMLCKVIAAFRGWKYRSSLVDSLGMGGFNKKFERGESKKEWITSDAELRKAYESDPLCSFTFTVNGYYHMFAGMKTLTGKRSMEKIPKTLPVFFVAGEEDPVGDFGKGVRKVYKKYADAGMQDVQMKLYPGDRHEILNETDRAQVMFDLYRWLEKRRNKSAQKNPRVG